MGAKDITTKVIAKGDELRELKKTEPAKDARLDPVWGAGRPARPSPATGLRFGPSPSSRMGLLFWPQLLASGPAVRPHKRLRTSSPEDDTALERGLGLGVVPADSAGPAQQPQPAHRASSLCVLDLLPATRAAVRPAASNEADHTRRTGQTGAAQVGADVDDQWSGTSPPDGARTLVTEEVVCSLLRPASASILLRAGFVGAYTSALDTLTELVSAYMQQMCATMRRCADSRTQRWMAVWQQPDRGQVAGGPTHILDLLQDALTVVNEDPAQLLRGMSRLLETQR